MVQGHCDIRQGKYILGVGRAIRVMDTAKLPLADHLITSRAIGKGENDTGKEFEATGMVTSSMATM
jgi:hypothetical protein